MFLVFVRHGGVAVLLLGVAAEVLAWLFGAVTLQPLMIALGALLFYLSEYGMHRFAFHAAAAVMAAGAPAAAPTALRSPCRADPAGFAVPAALVPGAEPRRRRPALFALVFGDRGGGIRRCSE